MMSGRSAATGRPHRVEWPAGAGGVERTRLWCLALSASVRAAAQSTPQVRLPAQSARGGPPEALALRPLTRRHLFGVFVVVRHIALVAAGQPVQRGLDAGTGGPLAPLHPASLGR